METRYHTAQSIYWPIINCNLDSVILKERNLTTNLGDTGAFRASAISCAFWLMLPLRVLIVRNASLKLF